MIDKLHVDLSEITISPNDLDLIINIWKSDPVPKTINEITRMYLTSHWEDKTGYIPYDRTKRYKKGDKIIIRADGKIHPADVINLYGSHDKDGIPSTTIELFLLDDTFITSENPRRKFISDYKGTQWAGEDSISYEIIQDEDETAFNPKILASISGDSRFVSFETKWLPVNLLSNSVRIKKQDIIKYIVQQKSSIEIQKIIDNAAINNQNIDETEILFFTINHLLDQDWRFDYTNDNIIKWDINIPDNSIQFLVPEVDISSNKFRCTNDLVKIILYNGFIDDIDFSFPYNTNLKAYFDINENSISGAYFIQEFLKLTKHIDYSIKFTQSNERGKPIEVALIAPEDITDIKSTITLKDEWINSGIIHIPTNISKYFTGAKQIIVKYDEDELYLDYNENENNIKGIKEYFQRKALAEGDKIHIQLETIIPAKINISTSWQRSINALLNTEPDDLDWQKCSLRDCIIVTMSKSGLPIHYQEIYSEISKHRSVLIETILGCLSRFSPSIFINRGKGIWDLSTDYEKIKKPEVIPTIVNSADEDKEDIDDIIKNIVDYDYIYRMLSKLKQPMSYIDICNKLAEFLNIDPKRLKDLEILDASDMRFTRLDDGSWALKEWFIDNKEQKINKSQKEKNNVLIIIYILVAITIISLIYIFLLK